jgi:hypothetical protein
MSAPTYVQRCREWIREQIDGMGTLRTSNQRDLIFKSWRQNTVTVLQRIWPEDLERVERFRRIVFTPPHSRADVKLTREWFGKGLGESRAYLQSILDIIDREGVPDPATADRDDDPGTMEDEVGFPMLDLDEESVAAESLDESASQAADESGIGVTVGYTTPDDQGANPRDKKAPAPPALSTTMRTPTPSGLRRRDSLAGETPPALGESDSPDAKAGQHNDRPPVQIPRAPSLAPANESAGPAKSEPAADAPRKAEPVEADEPEIATPKLSSPRPGMTIATKPPAAAKPSEPAKPVAAGPARPGMSPAAKPVAAAKPAEPARPAPPAPRPVTPVASRPAEPAKPAAAAPPSEARTEAGSRVEARGKSARGKQGKKSGTREKLKDLLGLSQFDSRARDEREEVAEVEAPVESAPEPIPAPEYETAPTAEAAEPVYAEPESYDDEVMPAEDDEDRERATLDFMQNSPVFGLIGKPVNRRSDTTEFLDPDAVAVATLAADVGRLGVPEGMRASIASRLVDVARRLDEGALDWALLRGTVTDAMQYPDLAKRLLPILLPWLERAA